MNKNKLREILYIVPLMLIASVTPLIVLYYKRELEEDYLRYFWTSSINIDFFSYYKMVSLLIFTLLAVIAFYVYSKKGYQPKKSIYYLPLAIYALTIMISTIFSSFREVSLRGFPDRYEGMSVLLAYILIVIITINLLKTKRQLKFILIALFTAATIVAIIGLLQFFGYDFFQSVFGRNMILFRQNAMETDLNYRFANRNIISSTFYNPNYVGSYFVMTFLLSFILFIFAKSKKTLIMLGLLNILMFTNWIGSLSRAGFLGGIFALVLGMLLLRKKIYEKRKAVISLVICLVIVFSIMNTYANGRLMRELISLGSETELAFRGSTASSGRIEDIVMEENKLKIKTEKKELTLLFTEEDLVFLNKDKQEINYSLNQETKEIIFDEPKYQQFHFKYLKDNKMIDFSYNNQQAYFCIIENEFYILGLGNLPYKIKEFSRWGFEGKENLASKRGIIWSMSIPLLRETIWKGFGPDTYALYYPQHDYLGKLKYFNRTTVIVDKPHNLYLQIAINTGLISLLAVLILFSLYLIKGWKLYWNHNYDSLFSQVGVGILVLVIGYLIAGIFNDSVISVAPIFWLLLGIGITINMQQENLRRG